MRVARAGGLARGLDADERARAQDAASMAGRMTDAREGVDGASEVRRRRDATDDGRSRVGRDGNFHRVVGETVTRTTPRDGGARAERRDCARGANGRRDRSGGRPRRRARRSFERGVDGTP